jgi:integration host factor subunit beta
LSVVKSNLIKQLNKNYPNFLKKDLEKFSDIIFQEIKEALKNGERVELRGFGVFYTNIQKKSVRRNPRTGEKVEVAEKKTIQWKMSKEMFNKLNNFDD